MYSFCCEDDFVVIIMFSVNVFNTKVVDNFIIFLVLKFQDFRITDLRVIDYTCSLSGLAYVLHSAAILCLVDYDSYRITYW